MEQQSQCSTASNVDPEISDSDPIQTNELWLSVNMSKPGGPGSLANDPTASGAQLVAKRARTAAATAKSTGKTASIDDPDFETTVLKPRGVDFFQDPS